MHMLVSNSCFPADAILSLTELPAAFGIEIQVEFGTDYYWKSVLSRVMKDRTGPLSLHGPFVDIDLSAKDLDEKALLEYHKWVFDVYHRHGATHFTVHPDGKINVPTPPEEVRQMRLRALDRIAKLADLAQHENVHLLVENLRPKGYGLVFDMEEFIDLFRVIPHVDCLIDTGHLRLSDWDFTHVLSSLGLRIKAYHINDTYGTLDEHQPLGRGVIDWASFFADYKAYTPDADMVLEYKGATVPEIVANARLIQALMR